MGDKDNGGLWVGFDLGGTKMLAVAFGPDFKPRGRSRTKTKGSEGQEAGLARMVETVEEALADAGAKPKELRGIGVGAPGPVRVDSGVLAEAANLGWKKADIQGVLQKKFGCPVAVGNDVDVGTLGEARFGAGRDAFCVLGVFPGTGIGAGCVREGRILTGRKLSVMELGHVCIRPGGLLCGCGRRGCLETVASRLAIATQSARAAYRGEAPTILAEAGTDIAKIRSGLLAKAVKAGDTVVEDIIRYAARVLGRSVADVIHLIGPDAIVLGGGLVEAMPDLYLEEVRAGVEESVMAIYRKQFQVTVAALGDDAGVMGAAALAEQTARAP